MAPQQSSTISLLLCIALMGCGGEDPLTSSPEPERRARPAQNQNVTGRGVDQLGGLGASSAEIRNVAGGVRREAAESREESERIRQEFEADPEGAMGRYADEMRAELEAVDPRLGNLVQPNTGGIRDRCVEAIGEESASACDTMTEESMDCLERGETAWRDEDCRDALAPFAAIRNNVLRHQRQRRHGTTTPQQQIPEEPLAPASLQPSSLAPR